MHACICMCHCTHRYQTHTIHRAIPHTARCAISESARTLQPTAWSRTTACPPVTSFSASSTSCCCGCKLRRQKPCRRIVVICGRPLEHSTQACGASAWRHRCLLPRCEELRLPPLFPGRCDRWESPFGAAPGMYVVWRNQVWHDSFRCDATHAYAAYLVRVWYDIVIRGRTRTQVTCSFHRWRLPWDTHDDTRHIRMWCHVAHSCVTRHTHLRGMAYSYATGRIHVWHHSFICDMPTLICMDLSLRDMWQHQ